MKINWNKMVAGALLASSITREANAVNFNYNPPSLEKTFEVAEVPSQNLAELNLVDQEFTDIYGSGPIACLTPCENTCWEVFNRASLMCMASIFPPACVGAATLVFAGCMGFCASRGM